MARTIFINGQQQHRRHREAVENKARRHDHPASGDALRRDGGMHRPHKPAHAQQRGLEAEKFHRQARGGYARGHAPLFKGENLHGLAPRSRGGDIRIKHADQGNEQRGKEIDIHFLLPEKNVNSHRLKHDEHGKGAAGGQKPICFCGTQGAPGVANIAVFRAQIHYHSDGEKNHQRVEQISPRTLGHFFQSGSIL